MVKRWIDAGMNIQTSQRELGKKTWALVSVEIQRIEFWR